jgi:ssDNA-binding Zn-finger/Zn-ribbon topoisomerase 1
VERLGRTKFLGCINYPSCNYTQSLNPKPSYSRRRRRRYNRR